MAKSRSSSFNMTCRETFVFRFLTCCIKWRMTSENLKVDKEIRRQSTVKQLASHISNFIQSLIAWRVVSEEFHSSTWQSTCLEDESQTTSQCNFAAEMMGLTEACDGVFLRWLPKFRVLTCKKFSLWGMGKDFFVPSKKWRRLEDA